VKAALIAYVAHCKRLVERKHHVASQLETFGLNVVWIEDSDPPEVPDPIWLWRVANDQLSEGESSIHLRAEGGIRPTLGESPADGRKNRPLSSRALVAGSA
jgi:hypothetical protein